MFSFADATWRRFWSPFQGQLDVLGPSKSPVKGQLAVHGLSNPPFQGQLDVPRSSEPPFQGQLDVTGCSKPPIQGQLDVPGPLTPPFQGQLDVQGLRNWTNFCKCSGKIQALKRAMSLKQSLDECNKTRQTFASAVERSGQQNDQCP